MNNKIISAKHPVTLVGGGALSDEDVQLAVSLAPTCVAADGGADAVLRAGLIPNAVIGDFDSISSEARSAIPSDRLHHIAEQDSTDFDKALRSIDAPLVLAVGFTGGRIDHSLSALHTLLARPHQLIVVLGQEDVFFLCPPRIDLPTEPGDRVSLFPMGKVSGTSNGLHWPIDGLQFCPGKISGTSNKATGPVSISVDAPKMICILPRRFTRQIVQELLALSEPARWPVRAER